MGMLEIFGITIGVAALIWQVVSLFPTLFHPKKELGPKGQAVVIGHRGSRICGLPENSLAAFKDAVLVGAEVIELDVWLSRDGQVVVHHDLSLARMCGVNSDITSMRYDEFPKISPSLAESHNCHKYPEHEVFRIPLLVDVFGVIPNSTHVIIEFKQNSDELVAEVMKILNSHGNPRKNNTFWFSLDEPINKKLRAADTSMHTITSIPGLLRIIGLYYCGLLPFCHIPDSVFGITCDEVTLATLEHESALHGMPHWAKKVLATVMVGRPPYLLLAPKLFAYLKRRGIPVWFLGVNTLADLRIAHQAGATAFLTDNPEWAVKAMKEHDIKF